MAYDMNPQAHSMMLSTLRDMHGNWQDAEEVAGNMTDVQKQNFASAFGGKSFGGDLGADDFSKGYRHGGAEGTLRDILDAGGGANNPIYSDDGIGGDGQGFDFGSAPQVTGINSYPKPWSDVGQGGPAPVANEVAAASGDPWSDMGQGGLDSLLDTEFTGPAADKARQGALAEQLSAGNFPGASGQSGPSSLASMGPNYETDVPVFQEAPVIDYSPDPMSLAFAPSNTQAVQNPATVAAPPPAPIPAPVTATGDPSLQAFAPSQETMPVSQDIGSAGIPNPPVETSPLGQDIGIGADVNPDTSFINDLRNKVRENQALGTFPSGQDMSAPNQVSSLWEQIKRLLTPEGEVVADRGPVATSVPLPQPYSYEEVVGSPEYNNAPDTSEGFVPRFARTNPVNTIGQLQNPKRTSSKYDVTAAN
tara:strand:+ start:32 stop:1291 length:1260 start_codon:yes stop_codon:yes gene_type:complete